MPVILDPMRIVPRTSSIYPKEFDQGFEGRLKRALTGSLGLTQFGVNITTLEAGARSAHRHWHEAEDECIYVLSGEITLITNEGETPLTAGNAAGFPAGDKNGHCLINKTNAPATYLEIGTRANDERSTYSDIDLIAVKTGGGPYRFIHKDGTPYE
jgi:uncharacterized cupin superfamily protein